MNEPNNILLAEKDEFRVVYSAYGETIPRVTYKSTFTEKEACLLASNVLHTTTNPRMIIPMDHTIIDIIFADTVTDLVESVNGTFGETYLKDGQQPPAECNLFIRIAGIKTLGLLKQRPAMGYLYDLKTRHTLIYIGRTKPEKCGQLLISSTTK